MTILYCVGNYGPCKKARNRLRRFGIAHDLVAWAASGSCAQIGRSPSTTSISELLCRLEN